MSNEDWPSQHLSVEEVRAWISRVVPGHPTVVGPTRILQAKDWGVTAAFAINPAPYPEPEVVFKACYVPLYRDAPRLAELLHGACPGLVPQPLAWRQDDRQTWTIFRPFRGPTVQSMGTASLLVDLARTMARVQAAVGARPADLRGLGPLPVRAIPALVDEVVRYTQEKHQRYWVNWRGPRAELMPGLPRVLARVLDFRPHIERWAEELAAGDWPDSVDHPDLHAENAVIQPDGRILIFDWEEATVTSPFFSLDELLANASAYGQAAVEAIRTAYIQALPWGARADRQRALDLALLLLPIKKAHEYCQLSQAIGRAEGNPHLAFVLTDGVRRWEDADASGLP